MYRLLKRARHRFLEGLERFWMHEHSVILRKRIESPPAHPAGFDLASFSSYEPAILELYEREQSGLPETRLRSRFERGLRFYLLSKAGEALAWTWVIAAGCRFVDEIGYRFPTGGDGIWERDVYVLPPARGRGIYRRLLDAVLHLHPDARVMYANVALANHASMRAHTHYGFEVMDTLRAIHIASQLMLRLRVPENWSDYSGFRERQRIVLTGRAYREYVATHLA
jgi:L-amino acid N-acyltransferase YncA